jgi:RHS repeat-associated protein
MRRVLNGTTEQAQYDYDYERRRIGKTLNQGLSWREYVYDGSQVSAEYGRGVAENGGLQRDLLARYDYGTDLIRGEFGATTPTSLWYYSDALGSVTALSNSSGTIQTAYGYNAWGERTVGSDWGGAGSPLNNQNAVGYTGQFFDNETGLMPLGNGERYYSASLGRFTQQDSFSGRLDEAMTLNRYGYANGNPLMYTDPTGHEGDNWLLNKVADAFSWADPSGQQGVYADLANEGGVGAKMLYAGAAFFSAGTLQGAERHAAEFKQSEGTGLDYAIFGAQLAQQFSTVGLRLAAFGAGGAAMQGIKAAGLGVVRTAVGYFGVGLAERAAHDAINNIAGEQVGVSSPEAYLMSGAGAAVGGMVFDGAGALVSRAAQTGVGKAVAGMVKEATSGISARLQPLMKVARALEERLNAPVSEAFKRSGQSGAKQLPRDYESHGGEFLDDGVERVADPASNSTVESTRFNRTQWQAPERGTGQNYRVYQQDINWELEVDGVTNLQRALNGNAPYIIKDGVPRKLNLHHSRQDARGSLFEVSDVTHQARRNAGGKAIHPYGRNQHPGFPVNRPAFDVDRGQYWIDRANAAGEQ